MRDELGPAARSLLDAAREGLSPSAAAIHRVRGKVGAAAGTTAGVAAMSLAAKLGIGAVIAAIALGTVIVAQQRGDDAPAPAVTAPAAPAPRVAPPTPPTPAIVAPQATPAQPAVSDEIDADKIEIDVRPPTSSLVPRATPAPTPAAPGGGPRVARGTGEPTRKRADLAREVAIIDDAMAAMRRSDYPAALTAVHQHTVETDGGGQLAEDAAAIEIEALCRSHHSVFAKLQAFEARWPSSAQRSRLTNNCP